MFAADSLVGQLVVPALRFVLFLYVQHIQKISLRASLVSGSDEYPFGFQLFSSASALFGGGCQNEHLASQIPIQLINLEIIMKWQRVCLFVLHLSAEADESLVVDKMPVTK